MNGMQEKPRLRRAVTAVLVVVLALAMWPAAAQAHRGDQSYLYLDIDTRELNGRVEMPYPDIREVFGLGLDTSAESILAELELALPELHQYILEHTSIGDASGPWELSFEGVELLTDEVSDDGFGYAVFPFTVDLPLDEVPQLLEVQFDPFLDEIEGRDAVLLISNDWRRGVFEEESNSISVFDASTRVQTVDLGDASQWRNFSASFDLGLNHIETGPDHILFILVLVLPSVLVFTGSWQPAPGFGSALWRVLKVATMFTIAHSITFTLAGLEILPLPSARVVESIIALSIAAAALHNLHPVLRNREWLIAFVFGLFHGMGFASLVESLEVSRTTQLVSLMGRNVGIEVGQVIVILITFPALFLLRRTRYYKWLLVLGSLYLAFVSTLWTIERVFETDLEADRFVERLIWWPRALYLMMIGTVIAAGVAVYEARRARLQGLPTRSSEGDWVAAEREVPEEELAGV